jgi:hypothetical protein
VLTADCVRLFDQRNGVGRLGKGNVRRLLEILDKVSEEKTV